MQLEFESARLTFRPLKVSDGSDLQHTYCDPRVMRYVYPALTPEQLEQRMPSFTRRGVGGALGVWRAARKDTDRFVGDGILLPLAIETDDTQWELLDGGVDMPSGDIEVGYILRADAWGRGYGTEICKTLIDFGFQHLPISEIVAVTDPDNATSMHVLAKSGLRHCGMRRAYASEATDFRINRAAWEARGT
ncbi:MAG: GNAT family N-acetyltransferase [Pseudomonadota bacterium]